MAPPYRGVGGNRTSETGIRMENRRGYYETEKIGDYFHLPVTVSAMNVMVNGRHWHEHLEILYCKKGKQRVRVEEKEFLLSPGDFVTVNSGESHEIFGGNPGGLQIICSLEKRLFRDPDSRVIQCCTQGEESVSPEDADLIREALSRMAYESMAEAKPAKGNDEEISFENSFGNPLKGEESWNRYHMYMYQLLMVLSRHTIAKKSGNRRKRKDIDTCIAYINTHLGETLHAGVLADLLQVSETTVYRLFSRQLGLSLNEYITVVRVEAVCRLLEETEEDITGIAYQCGFGGLSNFFRVFQKYVGTAPGEYRKNFRQSARHPLLQQPEIMKLNRFQNFYELGYSREELLSL